MECHSSKSDPATAKKSTSNTPKAETKRDFLSAQLKKLCPMKTFLLSAFILLLGTCGVKLVSCYQNKPCMTLPSPLLPNHLNNGHLTLLAAFLELGICAAIAFCRSGVLKLAALLWLCTVFWAYRFATYRMVGSGGALPVPGKPGIVDWNLSRPAIITNQTLTHLSDDWRRSPLAKEWYQRYSLNA